MQIKRSFRLAGDVISFRKCRQFHHCRVRLLVTLLLFSFKVCKQQKKYMSSWKVKVSKVSILPSSIERRSVSSRNQNF